LEEFGIETHGIFRVSGNGKRITALLQDFDAPPYGFAQYHRLTSKFQGNNIFDVADCLKKFFRSLSEPLFTKTLHSIFLSVSSIY
jgi:hypothetical protein